MLWGLCHVFRYQMCPNSLDPCLQPLMDDLCDGFIMGYKIHLRNDITVPDYEVAKKETVRILLLLWTADHPGPCETNKF